MLFEKSSTHGSDSNNSVSNKTHHTFGRLFFERTHLVAPFIRRAIATTPPDTSYGAKCDNIRILKNVLVGANVSVPEFFGLSDCEIKSFFSSRVFGLWRNAKANINDPSEIEQLQLQIRQDILDADLNKHPHVMRALFALQDKMLIVRSSSDEYTL